MKLETDSGFWNLHDCRWGTESASCHIVWRQIDTPPSEVCVCGGGGGLVMRLGRSRHIRVRSNEGSDYSLLPAFVPLSWPHCGHYISLPLNFGLGSVTCFGHWHVGKSYSMPIPADVLRNLLLFFCSASSPLWVSWEGHVPDSFLVPKRMNGRWSRAGPADSWTRSEKQIPLNYYSLWQGCPVEISLDQLNHSQPANEWEMRNDFVSNH